MNQTGYTPKFLRKRRMLLIMPLLIVPLLTLAFWAMGGGKAVPNSLEGNIKMGLNLNLPDANLSEDKLSDKLSFYDKTERDSMKLAEWMRSDPYYRNKELSERVSSEQLESIAKATASKHNQRLISSPYEPTVDRPEEKIMEKLSLLQKELSKPGEVGGTTEVYDKERTPENELSGEVDRLAEMIETIHKKDTGDTEMKQLEKTLDKILDVQHPERVSQEIREKSVKFKEKVFPVRNVPTGYTISLLDTSKTPQKKESGFYGEEEIESSGENQNAVEAVVHETQTLVNGAIIKLRLISDIYVDGTLIPKGSFVFGKTELREERLNVEINSIRSEHSLFPVKMVVYDMDGLLGIYLPGAITRDIAKQSADNGLQLMELNSLNTSLKAQAAAAGINTVKSLLSKKVKQVRVMVKAGFKVLLKDNNIQQ